MQSLPRGLTSGRSNPRIASSYHRTPVNHRQERFASFPGRECQQQRLSAIEASSSSSVGVTSRLRIGWQTRDRQIACQAAVAKAGAGPPSEPEEESGPFNAGSIGIGLLWLALSVYSFKYSPDQTPTFDLILVKLIVGASKDPSFVVNQVYFSVFNIIGLYTFFLQCLLIPAGRSANKIPAWPFVVASYALGSFALLPYFMIWKPIPDMKLPPAAEELEGWNKLAMKGGETKILPLIALAASSYLLYNMFTADAASWQGYLSLFDSSRLVHISSIDCVLLATLTPFWMANDAELRGWKDKDKLLPILSLLPVVGPATYLLLRPKTGEDKL